MNEEVHYSEHVADGSTVFNPHGKPVEQLPLIIGFINGGSGGNIVGQLLSEDGEPLGSHISSSKWWLKSDLGITYNSRLDRHERFREHYPEGYRTLFADDDDPRLVVAIHAYEERVGVSA